MIADYTGTKYCSVVCNGTASLISALLAYDIGRNDEVIVPDYTMIATANAVVITGAKPIFVDVEKETLGIDISQFKKKVTDRTKAVMLVSINGRFPKYGDEIIDFCRDKGIVIIEDAAQSLGSFHEGKHIGSFGDIGCFSFSMPKIITMGQGGALITNDKVIDEKIKMIKNFGRKKGGGHDHESMGYNFKFTDLQAVLGIAQMKELDERVKRKREMFSLFIELLEDVKGIEFIHINLNEETPWFIDVLVDDRNKLMHQLEKRDVCSKTFYPAIHSFPCYSWVKGDFPNSIYASEHGLWLPSSLTLTDDQIIKVCKSIKEI